MKKKKIRQEKEDQRGGKGTERNAGRSCFAEKMQGERSDLSESYGVIQERGT